MAKSGKFIPTTRSFPKLYNAKRQIEVSRGLLPAQLEHFKRNPLSETWRDQVSPDVVKFVDSFREYGGEDNQVLKNELLPSEKAKLFQDPVKYFSRPHNVPDRVRQQTYFPNFGITLLRSPHLGPRYAQFNVPLWFGKLDLKSYLKNLYDVDVNHVRSFVIHRKQGRKQPANRYSRGTNTQLTFKKKMTVELVEPFIWPEEPTETELDGQDHQKKRFWDSTKAGIEGAQKEQAEFLDKPDKQHRRTIAEQARALLAGKAVWKPTWQEMPQDVRVLQGRSGAAGSSEPISSSLEPMR